MTLPEKSLIFSLIGVMIGAMDGVMTGVIIRVMIRVMISLRSGVILLSNYSINCVRNRTECHMIDVFVFLFQQRASLDK